MTPVMAVDEYQMRVCDAFAEPADRLACYDEAAGRAPVEIPGNTPPDDLMKPDIAEKDIGAWTMTDGTDNLGNRYYMAYVRSTEGMKVSFTKEVNPEIHLRCKNNKLDVYIQWLTYVGRGTILLASKIGDQHSFVKRWNIDSRGEATFYPDGLKNHLLDAMYNHSDMWVRITQPGMDEAVVHFDITGTAKARRELWDRCRYVN